jgi:metal-responsive CopG/Arc/MetJ family transcriptional regulator
MKKPTGMCIDPEILKQVDEKLNFYGYRSRSHLVETLLERWVKDEIQFKDEAR